MKSFATLFGGSKKKDRDKLKAKLALQTDGIQYPSRLVPPEPHYLRAGSPASTSSSDYSSRSIKKSIFATFADGRVQQHEVHRPSVTRSFFRSATDVSKLIPASPATSTAARLYPDPSDATDEWGTQDPRSESTHPPPPQRTISVDPKDYDDPFASRYVPRLPPAPATSQSGKNPNPRPSLTQNGLVPPSSSSVLSVPTPTSRSRPRALSLGAQQGPADVLGPLPPLPQIPNLASMMADQALGGVGPTFRVASPASHSAPPQTTSFAFSRGSVRRLASEARGSTDGSPRRPVTRPPGIHFVSSDAIPTSERTSRPVNTIRIPPAILPTSISADAVLAPSASQIMVPRPPTLNATMARPPKIPELDQTWAQFLCETEADLESDSAREIQKPLPSSVPPPIPPRSKARLMAPTAPPPARPLPAVPPVLPLIAPLNISRRRGRAHTVSSGTSSPREGAFIKPLSLSTNVNSPERALRRPFTPPISPPPTAGSQLFFDSLLDVVVTPADTTPVHSPSRDGHRPVPETPGTSSSLPYLCKSKSSQDLLSCGTGLTRRPSSRSSDGWDASPITLSMFPTPPRNSPTRLQLPIESSPIRSMSAPPMNRPPPLLPPIPHVASAVSIAELETPPITPTDSDFPLLYSLGPASSSTSTIRPNADMKRDTIVASIASSEEIRPPSPRTSTESNSSSYATAMSEEQSEEYTVSYATTVSSHSSSTLAESLRSSEDSGRAHTPTPVVTITKSTSERQSRPMLHAMWIQNHKETNEGLKVPSTPVSGQEEKFSLLPSFFFEPKSGGRPITPTRNGNSFPKSMLSPRKERLLNLLTSNDSISAQRSPGSPYRGKVEWGEAI